MTDNRRIALVTGSEMAKPDPESHLLVKALADIGIAAELVSWRADIDWSAYPLVVIRTPWDYFRHLDEFLAWARSVEAVTRVVNPPALIEWNSHKRYLRDLAAQGVPTIPTLWLAQGSANSVGKLLAQDWETVVVKPAVSIGAIGAMRALALDPALQRHLQQLVAAGDVMAQPYIESIAENGELSLIYFGGQFSHAIRKRPQPGDYRVQDMYGGRNERDEPCAAARALGDLVLKCLPLATAYARVDMVLYDCNWCLMEVELVEPELFFPLAEGSAAAFAEEIRRLLDL